MRSRRRGASGTRDVGNRGSRTMTGRGNRSTDVDRCSPRGRRRDDRWWRAKNTAMYDRSFAARSFMPDVVRRVDGDYRPRLEISLSDLAPPAGQGPDRTGASVLAARPIASYTTDCQTRPTA